MGLPFENQEYIESGDVAPLSKVYGHAYMINNETYTINTGTIGTLNPFSIQVSEPSNLMVNDVAGDGFKMIVRRPGYYKVEFQVTMGQDGAAPQGGILRLKRNAEVVDYTELYINSVYFFSAMVGGVFYANANDTFTAEAVINGTLRLVIFGNPGDGRPYTRATIHNVD